MKKIHLLVCLAIICSACAALSQNQSGRQYRRSAVMNGNQVRTVFGNWGVIGQPIDTRPRGSWKNDNNGYLGDVSPFIGAEVKWGDSVFHSVATCPVSRPTSLNDIGPDGTPWTMEPIDGYFAGNSVALSNNNKTWPTQWPDKLNDPITPGWKGIWNGYFGKKKSADLETYFLMDDNNDKRFNYSLNNSKRIAFKPDSTNLSRDGMGLEVRVRALQWAQFLAQDNIFWLYEITNKGTTDYDRAVFGMLVGTYVGVTASADNGEWDDDWSFYDVYTNVTYTGDFDRSTSRNPRWVGPVGMVGYAFLESPGNPFDGIDNDGDADSSLTGRSTPKFAITDFDSVTVTSGMRLISIGNDYTRIAFTMKRDSMKVWTKGMRDSVWIYAGKTKLVEGNVVMDFQGNQSINKNANDGIDNNFNGLIDENQFVHYRQYKVNRNKPTQVLFNVFRPLHRKNYLTGLGNDAYSMIDERRDDLVDNNKNWDIKLDDVGLDGIGPTAVDYPGPDYGEGDGAPTSGYAKPELDQPGEPHIDKTDVDESDQIGLTSFYYFTPAGQIALGDKESLWRDLAPGFFDVPISIQYQQGVGNSYPINGEDGDFIYGSGFFPLLAKKTERFSLALVYGGGKTGDDWAGEINDLLKNKKTVQNIYDANYQFPTPPDPPTVTVVPGDHQVTLYWDRASEASIDPVLRVKDFEGYKVYKSTDPDFSDIFTITDMAGTPRGYRPIAQFDLKDTIQNDFQAHSELFNLSNGYSFYLGNNSGLAHSFVDKDVDNGRRYFYAVVAYDRGDPNYGNLGVLPGENTKSIRFASSGEIESKDINVVVVVPNSKTAGYIRPPEDDSMHHMEGPATGGVAYKILDEPKMTDHTYQLEFLDNQTDGIDNNANGRIDVADSLEWTRTTTFYSILDMNEITEKFTSLDTINVSFQRKNLIPATVAVKDQGGTIVDTSRYVLDGVRGSIRSRYPGGLPSGEYTVSYHYYPVYKSPNMQNTPYLTENTETDNFDGIQMIFTNAWTTKLDRNLTSWIGKFTNPYKVDFTPVNLPNPAMKIFGYAKPADYEIQFADSIVDTSVFWKTTFIDFPATPVRYRIYNLTDSTYVKFIAYIPSSRRTDMLSPGVQLILLDQNPRGILSPSWSALFNPNEGEPEDTVYALSGGDKIFLKTVKPFSKRDIYQFKTKVPAVDNKQAQSTLERIKVVPNPYVTASSFEPPLNPGITSGRGERKIDFIHLPAQSKINIYTSRGDHVVTLYQDGNLEDGAVSWNLKTDENLDVAFGVYFYVVESPAGNKTGKIAIIK